MEKMEFEYLLKLRDKHNFTNGKNASVKIGDIVQIKVQQQKQRRIKYWLDHKNYFREYFG